LIKKRKTILKTLLHYFRPHIGEYWSRVAGNRPTVKNRQAVAVRQITISSYV